MQPWSQFGNHKFKLIGYSSDMYDVWETWYKYSVNGKDRFYRQPVEIEGAVFKGVLYAQPINFKPGPPKRDKTFQKRIIREYVYVEFKYIKYSGHCCYCTVKLTEETRTKEHVVPKQ